MAAVFFCDVHNQARLLGVGNGGQGRHFRQDVAFRDGVSDARYNRPLSKPESSQLEITNTSN
jgi:hypothetical protein